MVAKSYRSSVVPFVDLIQEGTVGLVRAVERFDHRRGLKFSTYAIWWIRRSMLDAIVDQAVGEGATQLGDLIADEHVVDPSESAIAEEDRREVAAMLRLLPERHREVLIRRYGFDHGRAQSHNEIGEWLGVGEERSRQIEREALHRLRAIASPSARAA